MNEKKDRLNTNAKDSFFGENKQSGFSKNSEDADLFFSENTRSPGNSRKTEKTDERKPIDAGADNDLEPAKGKKKIKHILIFAVIALMVGVGVIYGMGAYYYKSHFLRGTTINGIDVSGMTYDELAEKLKSYKLVIEERGKEANSQYVENITGDDIKIDILSDSGVKEILDNQSLFRWYEKSGESYEKDMLISYDANLLDEKIHALRGLDSKYADKPTSAKISEYHEKNGYTIEKETQGNFLNEDAVKEIIYNAVNNLEDKVNLEDYDCYMKPKVDSGNKKLNKLVNNLNRLVGVKITYNFDGTQEVVDGNTINEWIVKDKKNNVSIDRSKASEFVATLRRKYDTIFRTRIFKTSYGDSVTLDKGDYGWWMNYEKETDELVAQIEKGESGQRTPVYYQTAAKYGSDDYGDSYVEINLTAQHLFVYVDGELKLETDVCTGNTSLKRSTHTGVYGITYKERYGVLVGETYESTVAYWMPFDGDIGLHDAIWKKRFGAQYYKTEGSHGCVNLPYDTAKEIYGLVEKGTPVIVYKLSGTESNSTTTQDDEEISHAASEAIDAIGSVTKDSKESIRCARYMYDKIGAAARSFVENYDILVEAEKKFKELNK